MSGKTPLVYAVKKGCWPIITLLRREGAFLNIKDNSGKSVLDYARNKKEIKQYLRLRGVRSTASEK